jgi:hypothetical protein
MFLAEIRDFDVTDLCPRLEGEFAPCRSGLSRDTESPEEEGAVVRQRQAEKTRRLMQFWSAQDLTSLDTEERAAQEQEMIKVHDLRRRRARYGASDCRVYGASKGGVRRRTDAAEADRIADGRQAGARTDAARSARIVRAY